MAAQVAVNNSANSANAMTAEAQQDAQVLSTVPKYLARGEALLKWWREVDPSTTWWFKPSQIQQFPLARTFNRPTRSFGFFGQAPVEGRIMPVMGNVQEMFYDQTRGPASLGQDSAEWMREQLREFVMKYFLRITSFRQPGAYVDAAYPIPPPALARLSWCPTDTADRVGFGFTQLFHKSVRSGEVRPFPGYDRHAIVDQREIGKLYEWLVLKVRIFDFNLNLRPLGESGPELVFGANEESYLAINKSFVTYNEHLPPELGSQYGGVLGDYGVGYAFVKSPASGPFRYGPGEFDAALELINFRIYRTGYISVRMVFIANRPTGISNLVIDPVNWGFRLADFFSLGATSRFLSPAQQVLEQLPLQISLDPVRYYVSAANLLTGGYAARNLCISIEQLEKFFLLIHFQQHYQTVVGSLLTWRLVRDWLDSKDIPAWVISGVGS
ncbi:MAG TPA: hypothetical protein VN658_00695 [Candidatus Acidoferrales bacterium]|nr:hypothetical protein [Candidatus Acidoferrales bacterium]